MNTTNAKLFGCSLLLALLLVFCIEAPGYVSMAEVGLGKKWLLHRFSEGQAQLLLFTLTSFALIHALVLLSKWFIAHHAYIKKLEEEGEE